MGIYEVSNFMVIPDTNGMALHAVVVYGLYLNFFEKPSDHTVPTLRHFFYKLCTCHAVELFFTVWFFFSNLVEEYMHETVTMLKLFEKDCMETYVAHEAKTKENSIDERLAVLEKKWVI